MEHVETVVLMSTDGMPVCDSFGHFSFRMVTGSLCKTGLIHLLPSLRLHIAACPIGMKSSRIQSLTPEIMKAFISRIYLYEATVKSDGRKHRKIRIIYNFIDTT
jgi:hypothetical protein